MIAILLAIVLQDDPAQGPIWDRVLARVDAMDQRSVKQDKLVRDHVVAVRERYENLRSEMEQARRERMETREMLREAQDSWRPIQKLVDRLIALGWKLLFALVLFAVLIEGTRMLFFWLIARWAKSLFPEN